MELKHNEELYNDILGYLERLGIGWTVDAFESFGKKFVTWLQNAHRDSHYVASLYTDGCEVLPILNVCLYSSW